MARARPLLPIVLILALVPFADAAAKDYIVGYQGSVSSPERATDRRERSQGFDATHRYDAALEGFAADLDRSQVAALRADPQVAYVVPDRPVRALGAGVPLAPGESVPTGVRRIGAATATAVSPPADGAVAVLDTGVGPAGGELDVQPGVNCLGPGPPDDDNGHGTHVAGTIAAGNDGSGVVGVAPGTRVVSVKVLDARGSGTTSQVLCGIDWVTANAAARGIVAANLSLGGSVPAIGTCATDPERAAICRASLAGVTVVAAAGNDGRDLGASPFTVPAAYPEVLTVSAFADSDGVGGAAGPLCDGERDDTAASFSNFATRPADLAHMVAAPGVCIRSTWRGGGTATGSGTSMAAPHVAGAVALCKGAGGVSGGCAGLAPPQVIATIRATAASASAAGLGFAGGPAAPVGARWGDAVRLVNSLRPADAGGGGGDAELAAPASRPAPAATAPAAGTPASAAPTAARPAPTPPAARPSGPARPSSACRTWRKRLGRARRALAGAKRVASRRPTKTNRTRAKRAAAKVSNAKRRVRAHC
jgi:subtilisin